MNCVVAGWKIRRTSSAKTASAAVVKTGAGATVCALTPAWAVAQIEQV
jgi:hypothetical protein